MYKQIHSLLESLATQDGQIEWHMNFDTVAFHIPIDTAGLQISVNLHLLGVGIIPSGGYTVAWVKERLIADSNARCASLFFVPLDYLPPLEVRSMLPDYLQYLQTLAIGSVYVYDPSDQTPPFALNFAYEFRGGEGWINKMMTLDDKCQVMWTWADETWRYSDFAKAGEGFAVGGFNTGVYWKGEGGKRDWQRKAWKQGQARHPHHVKAREAQEAKKRQEQQEARRSKRGGSGGFEWDEPFEGYPGWNDAWEEFMGKAWRDAYRRANEQQQEEPRRPRGRVAYTAFEACQVLGLSWSGGSPLDKKSVVSAYRQLAKKYHPDMLMSAPESERLAGEERFKEISNAYQVLCQEWNF